MPFSPLFLCFLALASLCSVPSLCWGPSTCFAKLFVVFALLKVLQKLTWQAGKFPHALPISVLGVQQRSCLAEPTIKIVTETLPYHVHEGHVTVPISSSISETLTYNAPNHLFQDKDNQCSIAGATTAAATASNICCCHSQLIPTRNCHCWSLHSSSSSIQCCHHHLGCSQEETAVARASTAAAAASNVVVAILG